MWCEKNPTFRDWDYEKKCNAWIECSKQERALYFFRELEMHFQFLVCVVVHSTLKIEKIMQLTNYVLMNGCTVLISERLNIDIFIAWNPHTKKVSTFLHYFKDLRAQCIALQWDAVSSFFILSIFVFQVEVMVPPAVQAMPRQGRIETRKGKDITLRCSGKGNPNPRITWSKKVYYIYSMIFQNKKHILLFFHRLLFNSKNAERPKWSIKEFLKTLIL